MRHIELKGRVESAAARARTTNHINGSVWHSLRLSDLRTSSHAAEMPHPFAIPTMITHQAPVSNSLQPNLRRNLSSSMFKSKPVTTYVHRIFIFVRLLQMAYTSVWKAIDLNSLPFLLALSAAMTFAASRVSSCDPLAQTANPLPAAAGSNV